MWYWGPQQQAAFDKIKELISTAPTLAIFDPAKETTISADASGYGIGAALLQKQENNELRPVAYVSRTLSKAESKYANIEREALAITWACSKLEKYITGIHILIETDHKPLIPIFTDKHVDDLSPRLQRFRIRMMRYCYTMYYTPGKQLVTADTLSRKPISHGEQDELTEDATAYVQSVLMNLPISDVKLAEVWQQQNTDTMMMQIKEYVLGTWPRKEFLKGEIQKYWHHRDNLTLQNDLLMYDTRLVIPHIMQPEMLKRLHEGHMGINKSRARARQLVWWPGISKDIENVIKRCCICVQEAINFREPLISKELPSRPWQQLAIDLFKLNLKWYVAIIDCYSRYIEVEELENLTTSCVVKFIKATFARHGVPEKIFSDNGPQFQKICSSEFSKFANDYGFIHVTSSPMYAQSNGMAEAAVKICKNLFKKEVDSHKALLAYRATPLANGFSPAELLFNRRLRTTVPTHSILLTPEVPECDVLQHKEHQRKRKQKENFDQSHRARSLPELCKGDTVWITDRRTFGTISEKAGEPRSYYIQTPTGKIRRNRFSLIHLPDDNRTIEQEDTYEPPTSHQEISQELHEEENEATSSTPIQEGERSYQKDSTNKSPEPQSNNLPTSRYGRIIKPRRILDL